MWNSLILGVLFLHTISAQFEVVRPSTTTVCGQNWGYYYLGQYYNDGTTSYNQEWVIGFTTGPDVHRLSRFDGTFDSFGVAKVLQFSLHAHIPNSVKFENQPLGTYQISTVMNPNVRTSFDFTGTGLDVPLNPSTSYGLFIQVVGDYVYFAACSSNGQPSIDYVTDLGYIYDGMYLMVTQCQQIPCVKDLEGDYPNGVYPYYWYWAMDFSLFAEIDNLVQSVDPVSASVTNFCDNKKTVDFTVPQGRYFIYKNYNGDFRSYSSILTNGDPTPKTISKYLDSAGAYSAISWSSYPPNNTATQVLSRFDFNIPVCNDFFGPEVYVPNCGSTSDSLRFDNLFTSTDYYLYVVNSFTDSVTGNNYDLSFTTSSTQDTFTTTYNTFSEKYILVSKNSRGDITSKLQVVNVNFVSFTADVLPDTVVKGWYRFIMITAASPACSTSVSCKFDNILVDAIPLDGDRFRCFTPPLSAGSHTFSILANGALYPVKTIQVEEHSSYIDSEIVPFDNTKASIQWDPSESSTYLGTSRIESFTYVQFGSYLKFTQVGVVAPSIAATSSSFRWTVPSNLQFLVIRTTFRKSNSVNYAAQSWVMVDCHNSYCGRRDFCNRYYGSQPNGTTQNALTPVDQNCQNLAYCLSEIGCVGTCTSNFISGLSNFALGRPFNNNPYALANPVSSTNTQSNIDWVKIATQLYGKNFDVIFRENYPPRVCPVKPVLDHPVQSTICGDPHFSTGNSVTFDIQEVGEFNWFTGFVRFQDSGNPSIDYSAQATVIDIQLTWYITGSITFLTGMSFRSRENPNGAFILSTKGGVLTAYDNGVPVTPNGQLYYFIGGNARLTSSSAEIFLNDGIQISAQYWYNLICATITISGVFKDITGIYGSVTPIANDNQNNQGNCGGQSFLVPKPFFNHNAQLADCVRVPTSTSAFFQYGLGVNNAGNYAREVSENEENYRRQLEMGFAEDEHIVDIKKIRNSRHIKRDSNPLCDSITNEYFKEMCNQDLPIMEEESGIAAEDLFNKMNEAALNVDLPSAVTISFVFNQNGNNLDVSYVATINGFTETSATLNLRSSYASVFNLDASSPWVDESLINFVGTISGQFSIVDAGCDVMYYASGKVDIDTSSSGWKTDSYSITGNCVEAAAPPEDVTPDTTPVDLTTQGLSTGEVSTGHMTSQEITTNEVTSQSLTTQPMTTGQMTIKQFCESRDQATWHYGSGYYCTNNGLSFIQCYGEVPWTNGYQFNCPAATSCSCGYGIDCTEGGISSPCRN